MTRAEPGRRLRDDQERNLAGRGVFQWRLLQETGVAPILRSIFDGARAGPLTHQETLYPFELFIEGTPLSLQASARSKERWKARVTEAARMRLRETDELGFLERRPLALTLYYFSSAPMQGDVDNIVKPIMDALISIAYLDDRDVERVVVQKFEPEADWDFVAPGEQLAAALDATTPVVYIRVDDDLSWRRL